MGTYEEWLAKKREERAAGNSSGSSGNPQSAQSAYEAWVAKKSGKDATDWWQKSGIEDMDSDFWAFAKDERRWLEQGAFSKQYSSNAERWRGNIAQERAWLEKYGARLGDNAQRISDALDGYEETLNYYDSLYAATAEYEKAGQKISDYITAGVDPAQIDMTALLQGKANVSSGATVVLATDQYSKAQEQLMQSFQPFTTGTAMDKDNQTALGKEVSGQRARTKMALTWLDQHQKELGEETYQGLKGYYENTLTQLDLMDSTIQWYADGKSAAVYQDMGNMIQLFREGKAPTAELAQQEESLYAEVQALQGEVDKWKQAYDNATSAMNEGRISEKNLQGTREYITIYRDNLRGYQQLLAQKEQELQEVQEREAFYWALATAQKNEDPNANAVIAYGRDRYASERTIRDQEREYDPNLAVGFGNANPMGAMMFDASMVWGKNEASNKNHPIALDIDHLSEDEKNNFFYLVGKGYDSMAAQYVNNMAIDRRRKEMAEVEEWAGTNFGTQVLALFQQSLLFPVAGYDILASYIKSNYSGLDVDPNLGPAAIKDSLNSGVAKAWDDWSGTLPDNLPVLGGKGLGTVYQMGVSTGESYGSAAAMGPYATIFMGLSAASSAYNEAVMNGASPEQALVQGAAQGVAEALFEKISIGRWLDGKDYGSIVKNALVQGGVEASEEMLTSITNAITDRLIMQDKSAFNTAIQSYIDQGYSKEEAEDMAWRELLEEIAFDSVSGFITGGVMGGGSSAVNYISTGKTAQQILAGAGSSSLEELQDFYVAQLAAGVQESDTAQEQKRKIAAWLRQGGEYTSEQLQQAKGMAEDKLNGREVVYPQAQEEAEPEYRGQRYEMAAEEIIDNARAMATEGFTGLGMRQHKVNQIANNLERAIRTGEITNKRIDQMKPTDISYLGVIEDALNVEIPHAKGIAQARANVRAAIEEARARYLGEATAPAIEIGREQAEQLRAMSDEELQLQLELERELRDDTSAQPIVRQQAQQALDVLEQEYQRRNGGVKNVQQQEQAAPAPAAKQGEQAEGGNIRAEVSDEGGQREDGLGAGRQDEAVAEGASRPVAGSEKKAQGAVLSNLRENGTARSAEEIGVFQGSSEKNLYVLQDSDIAQSAQWKRIQEDAEADGARVVLYAGDLKVYNPNTKEYSKVEGIHQVNGKGVPTYYIKADKRFRDAEQIYKHEKFHEIVDNNPELMGDLMLVLQMNYTKQEIARLVNQYIEAYEGIYGAYEEGMTEEKLHALEMKYLEEIFADVYGDIQRGKISTAMAKKAMGDQTDAVQRAAQNLRGIKNKKAPPKQSYSVDKYYDRQIDQWDGKDHGGAFRVGTVSEPLLKIGVPNKDIWFDQSKAAKQLAEKQEVTKDILKSIPKLLENPVVISESYDNTVLVFGELYDESGNPIVVAVRINSTNRRNHITQINKIRSVGTRTHNLDNILKEEKILYLGTNKKETQKWFNALGRSTPFGGTKFGLIKRISFESTYVKQRFSISEEMDEAYLDAVEAGDMETAQRMVDEAAKKAGYTQRAYHGTDADRFNVFDPVKIGEATGVGILGDGFYFADSKKAANKYGETVYDVYLKAENTYHASEADLYKIKAVELEKQGYDSVDLQTGIGKIIMVFDPQQIKSAEPATYDDAGNVIPLSERFNPKEVDIRYSVADDEAELNAEYARKMAEDEEPRRGKTAPEWETVRQSLDSYNAAAVEEKEKRAKESSIPALKNRIEKNEQLLRQLSDMITMAKKFNYLSKAMAENVEMRKGIIKETLEIDRKALKAKQEAKKQEKKTRREKKQEEEIREQKARIATEELADKLMDVFYTRKGAKWETRTEIIDIADRIIKDGRITTEIRDELLETLYKNSEVTAEADPYFSDVRKYVNGVRLYVSDEVKAEFGDQASWNAFKKKAFGNRIYLTNDAAATAIDIFTQELVELFGGEFTEDADLKTQLEQIVKLAEEGKAEKLSLAEMMQRMYKEEGWSVEDQMDELERRMDKELEKFSEKASVEIRLRQKSIKAMLEDRANFRRTLEIQRENRANSALMEQVRKRMNRLMKYRNRTTPSVRRMIDEQIGDLDTLARQISPNGVENLQQLLMDYGTAAEELGEGFIPNPDIEARLKRLNQRHLADMTVDEIRELGEALTGIITQVNNYNQMVSLERRELVSDMANKAQRELEATKGAKNDNWLHQYLQGHLDAKRFFGKISGWANGAWEKIGESLSKGEEKARRYRMEAMALFEDFLADKANQKWLEKAAGEKAVWETVDVPKALKMDGSRIDSIQLTPMMKVSLLMHSKNYDNLRHIGYWQKEGDTYVLKGGGLTIPDQKLYRKGKTKEAYNKGEVIRIPPEAVKKIAASCTEQEKAFAKLLTKYFDGMSKNAINEVSLIVDGWERAKVTNYFPIESDKAFVVTENDLIKQDLSLQGIGSLKERSHVGANPVYLFDATDALFRNIQQVSQYYGLTLPLRDLNAVMNATYYKTTKSESAGQTTNSENELLKRVKAQEGWGSVTVGSVEKTLVKKWGESAKDYIHKLSKNLQNTRGDKDAGSEILAKLRGNYARAVISFNPSSVLKQMSSYPVALAYLDAGDLIAGLVNDHFQNAKKAVNTLSKYSAVYWYRNQGNTRVELSEVMARKQFGEGIPLGYNWTQGMDSAVTRRLLAACMHHVEKTGLQQGSQESVENGTDRYWTEVAKLFNKVVLNTQSNTSVMERPELTRADPNNIIRFLTMFRTDAFQQFNMLTEAKGRMKAAKEAYKADPSESNKKRLKEARKFATKTVSGIVVGQTVVATITNLLALALFRDKDFWNEEGEFMWGEFLKSIAFDFVEGLAGFIAGLDWIWSSISAAIENEKWYGPEVSPIELLTDAWTSFMNLAKAGFKIDGKDAKKQFHDFVKNFAMALGVPLGNVEKYFVAGMRWFAPEAAEKYNNMFDEITKADLSNYSPRLADEAIGVIMDNRTDALSDADKAEIVRLYNEGEKTAVPSGIPTSFSYTAEDGEEVTVAMSPKQREEYRDAWNKVVSENLHSLLNLEGYQEANDEEKATYIEKLYKYANQIAQNAVDPNKEPEKWVQQGENAKKEGIAVSEYVVFRVDLNDITGKDKAGESVDGLKANRSMELLESMGWTDSQERNVYFDVLGTKSDGELTGDGKEMQGLLDAGLSWNDANNVVTMLGKKKDRIDAIANLNVSDKTKAAAMMVYGTDKEKKMFDAGVQFGVSFADYNEVIQKADADGSGSVSQEEAETYIRTMGLGWTEMAYLWQMVTDGKDGASNPFGEYWGAEFYKYAHRNDEEK